MAVLNSKFDILRGWPNGSAVAEDLVKATKDATDPAIYRAGHFVAVGFGSDASTPVPYGACGDMKDNTAAAGRHLALIIEGEEETSSSMSGTVTALVGGGYVVRLHLEAQLSTNAFGSATIPGGQDQFVLTRSDSAGNGGDGLAANGVAREADFRSSGAGVNPALAAGVPVTVINGVACAQESGTAEVIIGTCLKVDGDICEILVH